MSYKIKVLQRGQITLPQSVREKFDITEGSELSLSITDNRLVLENLTSIPTDTSKTLELLTRTAGICKNNHSDN